MPLNVATRQVVQVPLTYQADGGADWEEQTLQLYRDGKNVVFDDAVAHGRTESLAGQEAEFTIRCEC